MNRPVTVFRWVTMLSMVIALLSAFTLKAPSVGAQATVDPGANQVLACNVESMGTGMVVLVAQSAVDASATLLAQGEFVLVGTTTLTVGAACTAIATGTATATATATQTATATATQTATATATQTATPSPVVNVIVKVKKFVCQADEYNDDGDVDIYVPGEFEGQNVTSTECRDAVEGEADFTLYNNDVLYSGGALEALDHATTDGSGEAIMETSVDPTIGTRIVFVGEDGTGAESVDLTVSPGTVIVIIVINFKDDVAKATQTPVVDKETPDVDEKTGEVEIAKLFCVNEDLAGEVEFEVLGPEMPFDATDITGQAGVEQPDSCTPGTAEFEIFLNGEKKDEADFEVTVGSDGLIVLEDLIPVTDEGESHKIVEVGTGAEAFFEVEEGAVTKIIVINFIGEGGEAPTATAKAGGGTSPTAPAATKAPTTGGTTGGTTTLPNTGAGAGQRGMELGLLALLAIAGLGAAGVSVRRRAA